VLQLVDVGSKRFLTNKVCLQYTVRNRAVCYSHMECLLYQYRTRNIALIDRTPLYNTRPYPYPYLTLFSGGPQRDGAGGAAAVRGAASHPLVQRRSSGAEPLRNHRHRHRRG